LFNILNIEFTFLNDFLPINNININNYRKIHLGTYFV
jgi:hypothetical protein